MSTITFDAQKEGEASLLSKYIHDYAKGTDHKRVKVSWFPSLKMPSKLFSIRWFLEHEHLFYSDPQILQRLLTKWAIKRRDCYLHDLFRGGSHKDVIILAEINPIIAHIKNILDQEINPKRKGAQQENLDYFQGLKDQGKDFLIIDGQHRITEIKDFFHLNKLKDGEEPWHHPDKLPFNDFHIEDIPFNLNGLYFQEWHNSIKEAVLDSVLLITAIVKSGDIKELKNLFVRANSGTPMTFFEKLIIESWSPVQRYIVSLTDPKQQSEHIINISNKFSKFSAEYGVEKKGLAYCFSEMLLYSLSKYGKDPVHPFFGSLVINGLAMIFDDNYTPVKTARDMHKQFIKVIGNGLAKFKGSSALSRGSLCNAYITLCLMQDREHYRRKGYDFLPSLVVKDSVRFMDWFIRTETARLKEDKYLIDAKGNIIYKPGKAAKLKNAMVNDHSYAGYQRTIWGEKHLEFRERRILEDISKDWEKLKNSGVLSEVGKKVSNPTDRRLELAHENNWMDSEGQAMDTFDIIKKGSPYDVGHKQHRSDGGDNSIENTQLEYASANRIKSNN